MDENFFELIIKESKGEITQEESAELERIKNQSLDYLQSYEQVKQLWFDSGKINYVLPQQKAIDWQLIRQNFSVKKSNRVWQMAASIVLVLGVLSLLYYHFLFPYRDYSHYHAELAPLNLQLTDGSLVTLNQGSDIYISDQYNQKNRKLILEGEAYFEVVKNSSLPFEVTTGQTHTTVLGTTFNLWQEKNQTLLTVVEGLVQFSSKDQSLKIAASQSAEYSNSKLMAIPQNPNHISWKTGRLKFKQTPLQEVIKDIEHHYQVKIEWTSKNQELEITTQFEDASIEEVMEEIGLLLNLKITKEGKNYIIN